MLLIASIDGWMDASERISILCVAFTGFMLQGFGILLKDIVVHVLGIALLFSAYVSSWRVLRRKRILLAATASVGAAVSGVLLRLAGQPIQASTLIYIISSSLLTAFALMALLAGELKNIEEREKEAREAKQKAESEHRMYQSIKRFALSGVESLLRLTVQSRARHPLYPSQYSAASSDDELLEEAVNALLDIYRTTFFYNIAWEEKFYENLKSREGFIFFSEDSLQLRIPLGTGFTSSTSSEHLSEMAELEPEATALLLHPLVRRAAAVHQLPLVNKIYLGATHTRLEHMVGVAALAGKVADALYDEIIKNIKTHKLNNLEEALRKYIGNDEKGRLRFKVLVQVAALLHDVGHFGLGHAIDGVAPHVFERFLESEMLIRDKPDNLALRYLLTRARGTDTDLPEHVQWALTIRGLFDEKTSKEFVEDVLGVSFYETVLSGKDPSSSLAYLIRTLVIGAEGQKVTNSLDLDRVDYLTRDFIHTRLFKPIKIKKDILERIDLLIQKLISNANDVIEIKKSDEAPALFFAIKNKDKDVIDARDELRNIMYSYVYGCSHKLLMDAIATRLVFEACKILEDYGSMRLKRDDARRAILALLYAPTETVLPLVRLILDLGYRKDDEKKELLYALYDLLANYEMYANPAKDLSFNNNSEVSFNVNGRTLVIKKITLQFLINSGKIFEIVSDEVDGVLKELKANLRKAIEEILNKEGKIKQEIIVKTCLALDTFCERYVLWLRHSEAFERADAILSNMLSIKKCIALYSHASILRNIYNKVSIPPNDIAMLENLLTTEAVAFVAYFRNQKTK
jgi:HD superfamily phosphohydrolase